MDDLTLLVSKINELKSDNDKDHKEIKDTIKLFPCIDHATKLARLEVLINGSNGDKKSSKLDEIVTKRVMYIFGGVITGLVVLMKALPEIIKAFESLKQ
jgi:hypothetical protein